jgi:putative transposase
MDTHTMSQDNVVALKKEEPFIDDPITQILRQGARKLLAQALEMEVESFLNQYKELRDQSGF